MSHSFGPLALNAAGFDTSRERTGITTSPLLFENHEVSLGGDGEILDVQSVRGHFNARNLAGINCSVDATLLPVVQAGVLMVTSRAARTSKSSVSHHERRADSFDDGLQ
jgi:hypothetical protein